MSDQPNVFWVGEGESRISFERLPDGAVFIDVPPIDDCPGTSVELTPEQWASVVAYMSVYRDSPPHYSTALRFHMGIEAE